MKQFFIVLFILSCFTIANAQNSASSSTPTGNPGPVNANAEVVVMLYNAIEITPSTNWTYASVFMTTADFNGTTNAGDMGYNTWYINSTKPFDLSLQFTDLKSTRPVATTMPVEKLAFSTDDGTTWNTAASSVPKVASFGSGRDIAFNLYLKVNPGWSFSGGIYAGRVIVTATQL